MKNVWRIIGESFRSVRRGAPAGHGPHSRTWPALPAGLVVAGLLAGCAPDPGDPETALRETLAAAEAAAEAGDADALVALIARDYADVAGRDRRTMALMIRGLLMRYPRLELVVTVNRVELFSPVLAQVDLTILAAGAGAGRWSADGFALTAALRDDGDGWRVTSASWGGDQGI